MMCQYSEEQKAAIGKLAEVAGGMAKTGGYNPTAGTLQRLRHAIGLCQESGLVDVQACYIGTPEPRPGPVAFGVTLE